MRKKLIPFIAVLLLMASCSMNKKITYFQDVIVSSDSTVTEKLPPEITLRPEDKVSIVVNSKDPELSNLFNLPYITRTIGSSSEDGSVRGVSNYVVRRDGTIDFPVLGSVKVAGLTRDEPVYLILPLSAERTPEPAGQIVVFICHRFCFPVSQRPVFFGRG